MTYKNKHFYIEKISAEKLAKKMGILKNSEAKGKLYTVHVDGKFTDIEKWVKLI